MAHSIVPQRSAFGESRQRWRVCLLLVMGIVTTQATATAGPVTIPMEDDGGSGSMAPETAHEQVVITLFDAVLSQQRPGVCRVLMAADAVTHTPTGDVTGPEGFERYAAEAWDTFPDAAFAIDAQASTQDLVTVRWTMTSRRLVASGDLPATSPGVRLDGLALFRFEGGMIAESWLQYDRMTLAEQIEAARAEADRHICPPCVMP